MSLHGAPAKLQQATCNSLDPAPCLSLLASSRSWFCGSQYESQTRLPSLVGRDQTPLPPIKALTTDMISAVTWSRQQEKHPISRTAYNVGARSRKPRPAAQQHIASQASEQKAGAATGRSAEARDGKPGPKRPSTGTWDHAHPSQPRSTWGAWLTRTGWHTRQPVNKGENETRRNSWTLVALGPPHLASIHHWW